MFKVMGGVWGVIHVQNDEGGVSHVQCDGRGGKGRQLCSK